MEVSAAALIDCVHVATYLKKMGYENTNWKRRYAILDGRNFAYFKSESDFVTGKKPRGEGRLLPQTTAREVEGGKHICAPESLGSGKQNKVLDAVDYAVQFGPLSVRQRSGPKKLLSRMYYLSFDCKFDMDQWINAVSRNVRALFEGKRGGPLRDINSPGMSRRDMQHTTSDMTRKSMQMAYSVVSKEEDDAIRVNIVAAKGTVAEMIAVIESGVDVIGQVDGRPLIQASVHGNVPMISFLIEKGAEIDTTTSLGNTALHAAAKHGQTEACRTLLSNGANPEAQNSDGRIPAELCVLKDTYRLLSTDDMPVSPPEWPLPIASSDAAVEEELVNSIIQKAVSSKIQDWRDVDVGVIAVHLVASSGRLEDMVALHRAGYDIHAPQPQSGSTPMMIAAGVGTLPVLQYLLENKADLEHKSNGGNTALHLAARRGQADAVQLLIDHGADMLATNNDGQMPLDVSQGECRKILSTFSPSPVQYAAPTSADALLVPSVSEIGLLAHTAALDGESQS